MIDMLYIMAIGVSSLLLLLIWEKNVFHNYMLVYSNWEHKEGNLVKDANSLLICYYL